MSTHQTECDDVACLQFSTKGASCLVSLECASQLKSTGHDARYNTHITHNKALARSHGQGVPHREKAQAPRHTATSGLHAQPKDSMDARPQDQGQGQGAGRGVTLGTTPAPACASRAPLAGVAPAPRTATRWYTTAGGPSRCVVVGDVGVVVVVVTRRPCDAPG